MQIIRGAKFSATKAWDALLIANMKGVTCRLHWTDQPYQWHINNGEEVFVVLAGSVVMHYRCEGKALRENLDVGDIFYAGIGCEHYAQPVGEARVLVVEMAGSI